MLSVLILDEAQNIKNPNSKAAQAARELEAGQRLCLSGTPLKTTWVSCGHCFISCCRAGWAIARALIAITARPSKTR